MNDQIFKTSEFDLDVEPYEEEKVSEEHTTHTPLFDDNNIVGSSAFYDELFYQIYLEIHEIEFGFKKATEGLTSVLLKRGIEIDPSQIRDQIDLMLTRLSKITIAKRLCFGLGLHNEMDDIMQREMDLIYGSRQKLGKATKAIIVGENDKGAVLGNNE